MENKQKYLSVEGFPYRMYADNAVAEGKTQKFKIIEVEGEGDDAKEVTKEISITKAQGEVLTNGVSKLTREAREGLDYLDLKEQLEVCKSIAKL